MSFSNGIWKTVRGLGLSPGQCPVSFTTDGDGDPTITYSYEGLASVARSEESGGDNHYIVTFPDQWATTLGTVVTVNKSVNCTRVDTPASKTVELQFSGAIASAQVTVVLHFSGD